jgi:hypothetical protein
MPCGRAEARPCRDAMPDAQKGASLPRYDRLGSLDRNVYVEQEILGTVVGVEPQSENTCSVEIECEALEDVTAFEIISIGLPFEHIAMNAAAGSRLKLACTGRSKIAPGEKVKIAIRPLEGTEAQRRGSENALGSAGQRIEQTSRPVGTFAGPADALVRTREGHVVPQDTGDQGGGQN